jgi:hypothetical protein
MIPFPRKGVTMDEESFSNFVRQFIASIPALPLFLIILLILVVALATISLDSPIWEKMEWVKILVKSNTVGR